MMPATTEEYYKRRLIIFRFFPRRSSGIVCSACVCGPTLINYIFLFFAAAAATHLIHIRVADTKRVVP